MPVAKDSAPKNNTTQASNPGQPTEKTDPPHPLGGPTGAPLNPTQDAMSRGEQTFHDSMTGRSVTEDGHFTDGTAGGPVPKHRIVSNSGAEDRPKIDSVEYNEKK
jgi:hypothetical protein